MKTTILNNITKSSSKNFENNVFKLLPEGIKEFYLSDCGMKRANGYGSYSYFLDIEFDNIKLTLTQHTNSAPDWDEYQDLDYGTLKLDNRLKRIALMLIEENQDLIIENIALENE